MKTLSLGREMAALCGISEQSEVISTSEREKKFFPHCTGYRYSRLEIVKRPE
jgi:hypothetical protein